MDDPRAQHDPRFTEYRRTRARGLRNELIDANQGLATQLAKRFRNKGEALEDLTQVAMLGLLKSVERFDPAIGTRFESYAIPTILGELRRHFRDRGWAVRVPRRIQELYLEVGRAVGELGQALGRPATVAEVAEHLGAETDAVLMAMDAGQAYRATSLDAMASGDDGTTYTDHIEALGTSDVALDRVEDRVTAAALLEILPQREREIFRLRFVEDLTQSQIADRMGMSQMHVSRLLSAGLARLRERLHRGSGG